MKIILIYIEFKDKSVPYEDFVNDVAARITRMLEEGRSLPPMMSQRQAYGVFGRANVDRWRRQGKIQPRKRPGKVEYRTAELKELQRKEQDYYR